MNVITFIIGAFKINIRKISSNFNHHRRFSSNQIYGISLKFLCIAGLWRQRAPVPHPWSAGPLRPTDPVAIQWNHRPHPPQGVLVRRSAHHERVWAAYTLNNDDWQRCVRANLSDHYYTHRQDRSTAHMHMCVQVNTHIITADTSKYMTARWPITSVHLWMR